MTAARNWRWQGHGILPACKWGDGMTIEELYQIPLIDTHVHRVHPGRAPEWGSLGGGYIPGPGQEAFGRQTILYGMVMEQLRKKFAMPEESTWEQVEQERHRRYEADPQGYYRNLMAECNVAMHCLEIGSPIGAPAYTQEEKDYFNASIPEEKRANIVRFDRIIDELLPEKLGFSDFCNTYFATLNSQIETEWAVGLKSCAAYNGGLDLWLTGREEAAGAYERIRLGTASAADQKALRCYLLLESMDTAAEKDLPVQFHTGAGGGSWIDFKTLDPMNMIDFLQDKRVKNRVKVVLLHGGHPHEENTSYLTAQFANVYSDFSGTFYLCSLKGVERMAALLERAPLNKIMYGSDGVMFPEVSWFAHHQFRRQLARLLNGLAAEGYLTERRAKETAKMFCYDNALDCYSALRSRL